MADVTDADREAAKRFVYDYNVRDIFQSREGPVEDLAEAIAQARAEGRAAEREACAEYADNYALFGRNGVRIAKAIRARGEKGKD